MRVLIAGLPNGPTIVDFEEFIQLEGTRANTRLWFAGDVLTAFAYVDDYNNLCFETLPGTLTQELEQAILAWGCDCILRNYPNPANRPTLDASCLASNFERVDVLGRLGFEQQEIRSQHFVRSLAEPISEPRLPESYSIRAVRGESEVEALVALHQAAFESDQMTVEYRLAIMRAPSYSAGMDWLVVSREGDLAAFCIGSLDENDPTCGQLDPVGTHPRHRNLGLGSALMNHGLKQLKTIGARQARFGTSSQNTAMRSLGERVGFTLESESLWFARKV
jgi:ribosomal protein S18 acetylase RimI-like enzyme